MAKTDFNIERATALEQLPRNGKIHIIGVSGVAMAQLAIALKGLGYQVSGSDKEFYEPMGGLLRASQITTYAGYDAKHITPDLSLVVIGNTVSYENPEVLASAALKLKYSLFPKLLSEIVIDNRTSIVVSGTHGKSTTAGMLAATLVALRKDPAYFIGGVISGLPESLHLGRGALSVVEGDEYDSAFFAKSPKFSFYRPNIWIITSIEFDHADIYPTLAAIESEFTKQFLKLTSNDTAICCNDSKNVAALVQEWKQSGSAKIITYGENPNADYRIVGRESKDRKQQVAIVGEEALNFKIAVPGAHNAKNALATLLALKVAGLEWNEAIKALGEFKGVRRRQEVRASRGPILIDDFAHHPTAIVETLAALREFYPQRKLWAVFEPRSNTSRRKIFFEQYLKAFEKADRVVLKSVALRSGEDGSELLDVNELAQALGAKSIAIESSKEIENFLAREVQSDDLVVVMSNGSFDGLVEKLVERWKLAG